MKRKNKNTKKVLSSSIPLPFYFTLIIKCVSLLYVYISVSLSVKDTNFPHVSQEGSSLGSVSNGIGPVKIVTHVHF